MTDFSAPVDSLPETADLVIVGGGVVGLCCARAALGAGVNPIVLDAREIASGASNGHLGALLPHQPVNWSPKKQRQLDGLLALEDQVRALEHETGLSCGYRRVGRLSPLRDAGQRQRNIGWCEDAVRHWPSSDPGGQALKWQVVEGNPMPGWLAGEPSFGSVLDTLSARLSPRQFCAALKASVAGKAHLAEHCPVERIDPDGAVHLADGRTIRAANVILSAGWRSFGLAADLPGMPAGGGVKGQSALLRPARPVDPGWPVLYDDGVYVIAHDDGLIAVGSTSEKEWDDSDATDHRLETLIEKARTLCPALDGAVVIERWAGIRPKGPTAEPVVQRLESSRVVAATGGYKISFALAHRMAADAIACL